MIIDKNLSFKTYEEEILNKNKRIKYACPKCGSKHFLVRHCTYPRNICYLDGLSITILEGRFTVQRLLCTSCSSTHAILPNDIIPYKTFTESTINYILNQYFGFEKSISSISKNLNMSYQFISSIISKALWFVNFLFVFLIALGLEANCLDTPVNVFKLMYSHFNDTKKLSIEYFENQQWPFLMTKFFNKKFNENLSIPIYIKLNL
jgi:ribosomal protein S27AE